MAQTPYLLFKQVYKQGLADGLTDAAAYSAASAAMADALGKQSIQGHVADTVISMPGTRLTDLGPKYGEGEITSISRAKRLGQRPK